MISLLFVFFVQTSRYPCSPSPLKAWRCAGADNPARARTKSPPRRKTPQSRRCSRSSAAARWWAPLTLCPRTLCTRCGSKPWTTRTCSAAPKRRRLQVRWPLTSASLCRWTRATLINYKYKIKSWHRCKRL